jgi:lactate dehydrogenase-like 2-hydroxyacid dehydrogenase
MTASAQERVTSPAEERPAVFITRRLTGPATDRLRAVADVDVWDRDGHLPPAELRQRACTADALLTMSDDRVDTELLDACPKLRVVSNMAVGVDNFDLAELTRRGIPAGNTPGVLTEATADLTFAILLACARRLLEGRDALMADRWNRWDPDFCMGLELSGATLGVVGTGKIGQAVIRRARAFNMRLLAWSRVRRPLAEVRYVSLDQLLHASDIVTLHVALTGETRHLIGERELELMKPSAILVNTARGAIVDQKALTAALASGQLAAAGLDVFEKEPVPADDPLLAQKNCLPIPHIGSATYATRSAMASLAADNLMAGLSGNRLPNCVNPEVYDRARLARVSALRKRPRGSWRAPVPPSWR